MDNAGPKTNVHRGEWRPEVADLRADFRTSMSKYVRPTVCRIQRRLIG